MNEIIEQVESLIARANIGVIVTMNGTDHHLINQLTRIKEALTKQKWQQHGVMQVPQFEELLQVRLEELPYTKHLDDGQYNDGQAYGFECGARWAYEKLSSGTAVGSVCFSQTGVIAHVTSSSLAL
jgi:hypothetical protein